MEHGGGTIKRHTSCALLLIIIMTMCIIPSVVGTQNQVASDKIAKIGSSENQNVLDVNAASKTKKVKAKTKKTTKKVKAKKTYKKTYKKVTAKKYKYKVKVRYWYKGKWRYKYVTKYRTVSAASTTTTTSYSSSSSSSSGAWGDDPTLDAIIRSGSGFSYSSAHHTGAELAKYGSGDCWAFSDYLNTKLQAAGYQSRIIQYATSYSSQHRSVQVMRNGAWQTVPYRAYGYPSLIV